MLEAGSHFGHLKRKWNPKMAPYIFKEHNGIHVIDLQKTIAEADEAVLSVAVRLVLGSTLLYPFTGCKSKKSGKNYDTTLILEAGEDGRASFRMEFGKGGRS